ncbi:sigma-E factor negative regulatory protein [Stenotrophomonas maltophilia]|nr:sigma-E factor negative regulatory protein [Stenotrophomonas maltophilia]
MTSHPFNESQNHQSPAGLRLDQRHREQLSALVDGELGADEARFLLRRMEHDPELAGCQERWQLLGDVMRGQASVLAPAGFSAAVASAIAAEPTPRSGPQDRQVRRSGWRTWGGGAALAASVAAVALLIGGEKLKETPPGEPLAPQVVASQAELPPAPVSPATVTEASVDPAVVAVASVPAAALAASRRQDARRASASATRNLPFGEGAGLPARPWPRSSLAPAAGGALNASFPAHADSATFYPFEPRLQDDDLPPPPRPRD